MALDKFIKLRIGGTYEEERQKQIARNTRKLVDELRSSFPELNISMDEKGIAYVWSPDGNDSSHINQTPPPDISSHVYIYDNDFTQTDLNEISKAKTSVKKAIGALNSSSNPTTATQNAISYLNNSSIKHAKVEAQNSTYKNGEDIKKDYAVTSVYPSKSQQKKGHVYSTWTIWNDGQGRYYYNATSTRNGTDYNKSGTCINFSDGEKKALAQHNYLSRNLGDSSSYNVDEPNIDLPPKKTPTDCCIDAILYPDLYYLV